MTFTFKSIGCQLFEDERRPRSLINIRLNLRYKLTLSSGIGQICSVLWDFV